LTARLKVTTAGPIDGPGAGSLGSAAPGGHALPGLCPPAAKERSGEQNRRVEHASHANRLLERLAPARQANPPLDAAEAFVWRAEDERLVPVEQINRLDLTLLKGIERQSETLLDNTRRFADALPANNALLWGARGMGKSSLVKAIHGEVNSEREGEGKLGLVLVEIHREDIPTLPRLLQRLRVEEQRCILFCDDLSFHSDDTSYKSLKAVLEGGIEGRPDNVIFYATSNLFRHGRRLCPVVRARALRARAARRGQGMGDHPRRPQRAGGLAVHSGFGGPPRQAPRLGFPLEVSRLRIMLRQAQHEDVIPHPTALS
jgi:hypothetical protein